MKTKSIVLGIIFLLFIAFSGLVSMDAQNLTVQGSVSADNDRWRPLYSLGSAVNLTNSAAGLTAASFTLPANSMGSNGILRITYILTSPSLNLNAKGCLFLLDGITFRTNVISSVTVVAISGQTILSNRNDPQVQVGNPASNATASFGIQSQQPSQFNINTTIDNNFFLILTNAVSTDSITLECLTAEVYKKD